MENKIMGNGESIKELKKFLTAAIKNNKNNISVAVENIDTGVISFVNLFNVKISWLNYSLALYIPHDISFQFPYSSIIEFFNQRENGDCTARYENCFRVAITLKNRTIVSIRGARLYRIGRVK